jgi:hypothetical protein
MKTLLTLLTFFFSLAFVSCSKDEFYPSPSVKWYKDSTVTYIDTNNIIFLADKGTTYSIPNRLNTPPETRARYYYGSMQADIDTFDPNNLYNISIFIIKTS